LNILTIVSKAPHLILINKMITWKCENTRELTPDS